MNAYAAVLFSRKNVGFPILLRYIALRVKAFHGNGFYRYRLFTKDQDFILQTAARAATHLRIKTRGITAVKKYVEYSD